MTAGSWDLRTSGDLLTQTATATPTLGLVGYFRWIRLCARLISAFLQSKSEYDFPVLQMTSICVPSLWGSRDSAKHQTPCGPQQMPLPFTPSVILGRGGPRSEPSRTNGMSVRRTASNQYIRHQSDRHGQLRMVTLQIVSGSPSTHLSAWGLQSCSSDPFPESAPESVRRTASNRIFGTDRSMSQLGDDIRQS
jgi:hypothetical protein